MHVFFSVKINNQKNGKTARKCKLEENQRHYSYISWFSNMDFFNDFLSDMLGACITVIFHNFSIWISIVNRLWESKNPYLPFPRTNLLLQLQQIFIFVCLQGRKFQASLKKNGTIESAGGETFHTPLAWMKAVTGSKRNTLKQTAAYNMVKLLLRHLVSQPISTLCRLSIDYFALIYKTQPIMNFSYRFCSKEIPCPHLASILLRQVRSFL